MGLNKKQTSKKEASAASSLLRSKTANRKVKGVAASDLSQAPRKKSGK